MKCINKMRLLCLCGIAAVFMSGCGQTVVSYDNPYDVEPVELTPYREKRMKLIKNFILWTRYLF